MCFSNNGTQFQTKGSISDGALKVTYWWFVSYYFIFHVASYVWYSYIHAVPILLLSMIGYSKLQSQDFLFYVFWQGGDAQALN